jgi:hypothetical protein
MCVCARIQADAIPVCMMSSESSFDREQANATGLSSRDEKADDIDVPPLAFFLQRDLNGTTARGLRLQAGGGGGGGGGTQTSAASACHRSDKRVKLSAQNLWKSAGGLLKDEEEEERVREGEQRRKREMEVDREREQEEERGRLESLLKETMLERDAALQQSEHAYKALKELRRGNILAQKNGKGGGRAEDLENCIPLQEQLKVLKNKVMRRDMRIEQLTTSEKHLRAAAATVGNSAALIRAEVRADMERLRQQRNELREENQRLRRQRANDTFVS